MGGGPFQVCCPTRYEGSYDEVVVEENGPNASTGSKVWEQFTNNGAHEVQPSQKGTGCTGMVGFCAVAAIRLESATVMPGIE